MESTEYSRLKILEKEIHTYQNKISYILLVIDGITDEIKWHGDINEDCQDRMEKQKILLVNALYSLKKRNAQLYEMVESRF